MKYDVKEWLDTLRTKTLHGICSGVSEGKNEVAGRIRFLAKFKQPKAIALGAIVLAAACVAVFCLGGDNPIVVTQQDSRTQGDASSTDIAVEPTAPPENTDDSGSSLIADIEDSFTSETVAATSHAEYTIWFADLTHDGQDEQIIWDDIAFEGNGYENLYVQTAGSEELISEDFLWVSDTPVSISYAGNVSYTLYQDTTGDSLLKYYEGWYSGNCYASYELFYLSATGEKIVIDSAEIELLTDGMPVNETLNDIDAILDFWETANDYTANAYVLASTLGTVSYRDVTSGETITNPSFLSSTEAAPVQVIPNLLSGNIELEADSIPTEGNAAEILRAQLEVLNEKRTANYAEVYAEQNATTIEMVLEGFTEEVAAVRYQMDGYSIAIPNDKWEMTSENHWQAINNEQISFEILCTTEADIAAVAQSYWGETGIESIIHEYPARFLGAGGQTYYLLLLGNDDANNYYYMSMKCFDEAMEGYGTRMIYIADTLIID